MAGDAGGPGLHLPYDSDLASGSARLLVCAFARPDGPAHSRDLGSKFPTDLCVAEGPGAASQRLSEGCFVSTRRLGSVLRQKWEVKALDTRCSADVLRPSTRCSGTLVSAAPRCGRPVDAFGDERRTTCGQQNRTDVRIVKTGEWRAGLGVGASAGSGGVGGEWAAWGVGAWFGECRGSAGVPRHRGERRPGTGSASAGSAGLARGAASAGSAGLARGAASAGSGASAGSARSGRGPPPIAPGWTWLSAGGPPLHQIGRFRPTTMPF